MTSLRGRALQGTAWTLLGFSIGQVLRLAGNLVMARLLFPEAFGLVALATTLLGGFQLFSDLGVATSIIQHDRGDDPRFLDTAWVLQILRGLGVWLAASIIALPFAAFYDEPQLSGLVAVIALTAAISAFDSTKLNTARRHLALGRVTLLEVGAQAVSLGAMLAWAFVHRSVWALVVGGVVGSTFRMIASHVFLPGARNRLAWDPLAWRSLLRFGRWIYLSTILTFLALQTDRMIFGRLVPIDVLGVYSVGAMLAAFAGDLVGRLGQSVVLPLYSGVMRAGRDLAAAFHTARRLILLGAGCLFGTLVASGPALVEILYDERYHAAGWALQLLAAGGFVRALASTNGTALLARGEAHWIAAANGTKLASMLVLIPLGYAGAGFPGAVAGFASSELAHFGVLALAASRAGLPSWRGDLLASAVLLVAALVGARVSAELGGSAWLRIATGAGVVGVAWAPFGALQWHLAARNRRATLSPPPPPDAP